MYGQLDFFKAPSNAMHERDQDQFDFWLIPDCDLIGITRSIAMR
jgi:hypothetical protein